MPTEPTSSRTSHKALARSPDGIDAYVGARIQARRQALGLTLSAVAEALGISFQQLRKYETGTNRLSASRLHRLAEALNTSVAAFFPTPTFVGSPSSLGSSAAGTDIDGALTVRDTGDTDWRQGWSTEAILITREGRMVAARFPCIEPPSVRRAVAALIESLVAA
ncbi:helix-turn-helix domain-containing protein [soil metagenome]